MDIDTLYHSMQDNLKAAAWETPGEFEENLAEANLAFMEAVRTYNPNRGPLPQRISRIVRLRLADQVRKAARRHRLLKRSQFDQDAMPGRPDTGIESRVALLSRDARDAIFSALGISDFYENLPPWQIRRRLRKHLRGKGWSVGKINKIFREVREALSD